MEETDILTSNGTYRVYAGSYRVQGRTGPVSNCRLTANDSGSEKNVIGHAVNYG